MYKAKVIIIDDDPEILMVIKNFFGTRGYVTSSYADAQLALKEITEGAVNCDVIISDLMIPGMSGIEFTEKLKKAGVYTPIIMITANKKVETAVEAIRAGAYDFVVKPINFSQLLLSVERAIQLAQVKEEMQTLKTAVQLQEGLISENGIVGRSPGIKKVIDLARRVASFSSNVLITGESGTGKEIVAKAIHNLGPRRHKAFIAINCSAIPENLLESEIFGHAKGAFTGAVEKKIGLFEEADGGTLFLDEIGDLALPLQAKILRVLQDKKIKRIGENQYRTINARIISATHKNLRQEIIEGRFREDLFFRLNVIPIWIPPLRERKEDILLLAEYFLKKYVTLNESGTVKKTFSKEALQTLVSSTWPGNVRELENTVERAVVLSRTEVISAKDVETVLEKTETEKPKGAFDFDNSFSAQDVLSVDELVNRYILFVLRRNQGLKEKTAKDLQIDRKTLYRKLKEMDTRMHLN